MALKKDINSLQPPTQKGVGKDLAAWKSVDELAQLAAGALYDKYPEEKDNPISRMDVRPSKGIAKVLFKQRNWEVQIDGTTGEIKSIEKRRSDWIESLHDGSIISDNFKLISMILLGLGLIFMIMTGLWLYYGPKKYREAKLKQQKS